MNTTRLFRLLLAITGDYKKFQIDDLLQQSLTLLKNRDKFNRDNFAAAAEELRERAQKIIDYGAYIGMSQKDIRFLDDSEFGPTLPHRLAKIILDNVIADSRRAPSSSELDYFYTLFVNNEKNMILVRDTLGGLPLLISDYSAGEVHFSIIVSEKSYEGDLTRLSTVFEQFDRFVDSVREIAAPEAPKPRVAYLDNGSAVATCIGVLVVVQSLIAMYSAAVRTAEATATMLKAMGVIKSSGVDAGISQEKVEEFSKGFMDRALDEQLKMLEKHVDREISQDQRTKLRVTSTAIFQRIKEGSKISVDTVVTEEFKPDADVSDAELNDEPPKLIGRLAAVTDLIAKSRELAESVDSLATAIEPMRRIEGPGGDAMVSI